MCRGQAAKGLLTKLPHLISKSSGLAQLGVGTVTGLTTGCVMSKLGKTAVAVTGTGILLAQVAHSQGWGSMDWKKIKTKAHETTKAIDTKYHNTKFSSNMKEFSQTNPYFTAGFVGGFLIGMGI
ncbi:hypothetical protein PPYR_04625 [Photinus pyralis]|uniref:FUN14 domain-containing protein n=1 Tax=Photinus pyralis TaxID=7054 RepID=A0A1Y1KTF7_PHOPY|nr:FUN14 domain-containing protein 2-like [Photinus pyralis]XP_031332767.1 FUN14 domain-containing protein 2-like [Photinus pyralis]KAB0802439.1 hypothetical protein PPYR_04625 [Photinus pyralis]